MSYMEISTKMGKCTVTNKKTQAILELLRQNIDEQLYNKGINFKKLVENLLIFLLYVNYS